MSSWSLIVGKAGTRKNRAARSVARALESRGLGVAGFLQEEVTDDQGETLGWDVVRITDDRRFPLARVSADPTLCGYRFDDEGFARAAEWARAAADVVVVGGVGKLEAAERGHWPVLSELIASASAPHVMACVRDSSLATIALSLPDPSTYLELPCDAARLEAFVREIEHSLGDP
jgi:nucleoside-triphosphatase THEP1